MNPPPQADGIAAMRLAPAVREIGKHIGGHVYVHLSGISGLPDYWQSILCIACELARTTPGTDFNVVRCHEAGDDVSLLDYPTFFDDPFPPLARSWRISISRKTVAYRTYTDSRNPPILHRKELLLERTDPRVQQLSDITAAAEQLGLFDQPTKIGFRDQWHALIATRGYELIGTDFVPLANSVPARAETVASETAAVARYLTALARYNFSAPVQALSRYALITSETTFFDYGCGKGDDVRGLVANRINATGWDPHFAAEGEKRLADVVNIGFVINVIEDIDERIEALRGAYACTKGVLAVAAMLSSQALPDGRPFGDGYLTSRKTFQKYFTQAQLRDFIEHTLDEIAIAAGPGVFLVFRNKDLEQQFLSKRYAHRAPTFLSRGWIAERPVRDKRPREKAPRPSLDVRLFEEHKELLESLWITLLQLGRMPDVGEFEKYDELTSTVGPIKKCLRAILARYGPLELERARDARTADVLVLLAMERFEKRKPYRHLEARLQRDIRAFFGNYLAAQTLATKALYEVADAEIVNRACKDANESGLGWLEESHSLQLHTSLVERLPIVLRIFVGCATVLYGDISDFDLVKIHIRSGKISLLKFENFENSALPRLKQRVKVMLRAQEMDIFDYGPEYPSPVLYHKARYINEEFPRYPEQLRFDETLEGLGVFDLTRFGPPEAEFMKRLSEERWEIEGFNLIRSRRTPNLDEKCGAYLTYRQLIECGDTQARSQLDNLPSEADSYTALFELCRNVIDPIIEYFGMVKLTYGFCSPKLARNIKHRTAPALDQHAAYEKNRHGKLICPRLGAACDFVIEHEDMLEVAEWAAANTRFDRLYYYGPARPIHISYSANGTGDFVEMQLTSKGRLVPKLRPKTNYA